MCVSVCLFSCPLALPIKLYGVCPPPPPPPFAQIHMALMTSAVPAMILAFGFALGHTSLEFHVVSVAMTTSSRLHAIMA